MDEVNQALHKIAKGTGIVFAGTIIATILGFLTRAIIARYFETDQYGLFSLALTVLNIGVLLALLGLQSGLSREISLYRKRDPEKVPELVSTAVLLVTATSITAALLIALGSRWIAAIFQEESLSSTLRILAPSLPFAVMMAILVTVSRGFGRVKEKVYYQNIVYPVTFLAFTILGILGGFGFTFVFVAYVLSQFLGFITLFINLFKLKLLPSELRFNVKLGIELLTFSLPLMLTGILDYVMSWTDTLMLGYYMTSEVVGLYNAAAPIARMLPVFLNSAGFLYIPTATAFFAQGKLLEMKRIYQVITRWIFLLTFPAFVLILVFPEATIGALFGPKYTEASLALEILAIGFMFHTFLGLNGMSLTIIGETRANLVGNLFAATANILLNVLLIPIYGIEGAATATAVSYIIANIFRSTWLYKKTGIHPFSESYVKQLLIGLGMVAVLKLVKVPVANIWMALVILLAFFAVYFALILLMRSVELEDVELLSAVERKFGIRLGWIKGILERFL
ncbi:flippase [Thermococcus sp. CX2]|uniref:flippase n=1 Tax=Thermococcus sp. CX2 TaxID=163006 RepID=UPI00143B5920|nr:flippase [Thermococcus sp. CX2]